MVRDDIVIARIEFLSKMHLLRNEPVQRLIIYPDETWVNQNQSKNYLWQHLPSKGGLRAPVCKRCRLIVYHAEKASFVEGTQLVFQSKISLDCHLEMNYIRFRIGLLIS